MIARTHNIPGHFIVGQLSLRAPLFVAPSLSICRSVPLVCHSEPPCLSFRAKQGICLLAGGHSSRFLTSWSRFGMTILREVRGSRTGQNLLAYAGPSASLALPRTPPPQNHGRAGVRRVYWRGGHHDHVLPHALPHPAGQDIIPSQPVESSVFLASILVFTIGNFCPGVPVSDDVAWSVWHDAPWVDRLGLTMIRKRIPAIRSRS